MALGNWLRIERPSGDGRVEIGARRIYILPTSYGLLFGVLLFLMLLGAVNYVNNPAHLLTFLLAGLGANAIYLTWRNLRGLRLVCHGAAPVFAGEPVRFLIELDSAGRERPAIQVMFEDNEPALVDLADDTPRTALNLALDRLPRGLHPAGRLVVSSRYPMGLLRAWCYVDCDRPVLVYPKPGRSWTLPGSASEPADGESDGDGNEDFVGLRPYHAGDRPARIDWKSFARGRGLNTRLFAGQGSAPLWIDWRDAPGDGTEARLGALTRAVLDTDDRGRQYGLRTPAGEIAPGTGPAHRHQCLRHLALYGQDDA